MSKVKINCALAVLLRDSEDVLSTVSAIHAAEVLMSTTVAKKLAKCGVRLSCADAHTIKTPAHPVLLSGDTVLDAGTDFDGCYLVCDGSLTIRHDGAARAAALEGAFVDGRLLYPASLPARVLANLRAERKIRYPDGACLIPDDLRLDAQSVAALADGVPVCVGGTLYAPDAAAAAEARARGITFSGERLIAQDSVCAALDVSDFARVTRIPDGHAYVAEPPDSLALLAELHGPKVFLPGDLTVQPGDIDALARFTSIRVRGEARVTQAALEAAKRVITAKQLHVFDGIFLKINGKRTMDHAELTAAQQSGVPLSVKVNGVLTFAPDVTPEDIAGIAALDYNGIVVATGEVRRALAAVIGRANGTLRDTAEPSEPAKSGADDGQSINAALYALLD